MNFDLRDFSSEKTAPATGTEVIQKIQTGAFISRFEIHATPLLRRVNISVRYETHANFHDCTKIV